MSQATKVCEVLIHEGAAGDGKYTYLLDPSRMSRRKTEVVTFELINRKYDAPRLVAAASYCLRQQT